MVYTQGIGHSPSLPTMNAKVAKHLSHIENPIRYALAFIGSVDEVMDAQAKLSYYAAIAKADDELWD